MKKVVKDNKNYSPRAKIIELKKMMNAQELSNKDLATRLKRAQHEVDANAAHTEKAKNFKDPKPPIAAKKKDLGEELTAQLASGPLSTSGSTASSAKTREVALCECGAENPKLKGYCEDCVKKFRDRFLLRLEKFSKIKKEYEKYNQDDSGAADEKLKLLKNKLAQYGVADADMVDLLAQHDKLLKSDEGKAIAEMKARVQALESQILIEKQRQDIELESLRRQQNYYDVQIIKRQGQKRDILAEMDQYEERADELQAKQEDNEKKITLLKR